MYSEYDWSREQAILDLQSVAVMERAKKEQCIYLFVEGESEEKSFDNLLLKCNFDIEKEGIIIANCSGFGSLSHCLNLLKKTLSSERPAIITYDDDPSGKKKIFSLQKQYINDKKIIFFPIPIDPIVEYEKNIKGGSFEEMFDCDFFLECCFSKELLNEKNDSHLKEFLNTFVKTKPWLPQVKKYFNLIYHPINKIELAILLSERITEVPKTIIKLKEKLLEIRKNNPITSPDDVELPLIPGLTV
jgi:predicted ATP-dependent endonuclease of OLD family